MHSWKDTLDYSANTMESALQYERLLNVGAAPAPGPGPARAPRCREGPPFPPWPPAPPREGRAPPGQKGSRVLSWGVAQPLS